MEIVDYCPCTCFFPGQRGEGSIPGFSAELRTTPEGTRLRCLPHPDALPLPKLLVRMVAMPYGRRNLDRYFPEVRTMLDGRDPSYLSEKG